MNFQEIEDYYFPGISATVGKENIKYVKDEDGYKIKIQLCHNHDKILKTLSKLHWTLEKLKKVAGLKTDMSIELFIKKSENSL